MNSQLPREKLSPTLRISTGSRLHFGLLDVVAPFGGVGVMIQGPKTEIEIQLADTFNCIGEGHDRIAEVARRFQKFFGLPELPRCRIQIVSRPKPHTGLGTGTQLAMAGAQALTAFLEKSIADPVLATQIANRGKRSAVGVHGFFSGGLIFERPDGLGQGELNPICRRVVMPSEWHVVLFTPKDDSAVSGDTEQKQFDQLPPIDIGYRRQLEQLITTKMLRAVEESDFDAFANVVHQYNRKSGMMFASVQGGAYNGERVTHIVERLIAAGAPGVGQSSWGPTVFSWFPTRHSAESFVGDFDCQGESITITNARNQPWNSGLPGKPDLEFK